MITIGIILALLLSFGVGVLVGRPLSVIDNADNLLDG